MVYYMLALSARCDLCGMIIHEDNNTNNEEDVANAPDNQDQES